MYSCRRTFLAFLMVTGVARAGAVVHIELVPSPPTDPGGYQPGETVQVAVRITQDTGASFRLRMLAMDFRDTDPAIELMAYNFGPMWQNHQVVCGLADNFCGMGHLITGTDFSGEPIVAATFWFFDENAYTQAGFPAAPGFLNAGVLTLALPNAPGTYLLDALHVDAIDEDEGARIDFGHDVRTTWTVLHGDFSGGSHAFTVVPEPVTLALVAAGGVLFLRPRRRQPAPVVARGDRCFGL